MEQIVIVKNSSRRRRGCVGFFQTFRRLSSMEAFWRETFKTNNSWCAFRNPEFRIRDAVDTIQLFWQIVIHSGSYLSLLCLQNTQTVQIVTAGRVMGGSAASRLRSIAGHYLCSWNNINVKASPILERRGGKGIHYTWSKLCATPGQPNKNDGILSGVINKKYKKLLQNEVD